LVGILFPTNAFAHAFMAGADSYQAFLEGVQVVLFWPPTMMAMIALGLFASLWRANGMVLVWPYLILGQMAGILISALNLQGMAILPYLVGILLAFITALELVKSPAGAKLLAAAIGFAVTASALEGHPLASLPLMIYLGIFVAANMGVATTAALVAISLERLKYHWVVIGWKIVASWLIAIMMLQLAFELKP